MFPTYRFRRTLGPYKAGAPLGGDSSVIDEKSHPGEWHQRSIGEVPIDVNLLSPTQEGSKHSRSFISVEKKSPTKKITTFLCLGQYDATPKVENPDIRKKQKTYHRGKSISDEKKSQKKQIPTSPCSGLYAPRSNVQKSQSISDEKKFQKNQIPSSPCTDPYVPEPKLNKSQLGKKSQKKQFPVSLCMGPYVPRSNDQKSLIANKKNKICGETSISGGKKSQKNQIMRPYVHEPKYKKSQFEKNQKTHLGQTSISDGKKSRKKNYPSSLCIGSYVPRSNIQKSQILENQGEKSNQPKNPSHVHHGDHEPISQKIVQDDKKLCDIKKTEKSE